MKKNGWWGLGLLAASSVSAQNIEDIPCSVIVGLWDALLAIGAALIALMFMYGAAKYAYGADDPGGRKLGKNIIIHAIIGGLILSLIEALMTMFNLWSDLCPGMVAS